MALWICLACRTAYSPEAPACPQCGGTAYRPDYEEPEQEPAAAVPAPPAPPAAMTAAPSVPPAAATGE